MKNHIELKAMLDEYYAKQKEIKGELNEIQEVFDKYENDMLIKGVKIYGSDAYHIFEEKNSSFRKNLSNDWFGVCIRAVQFMQKFMKDNPID